jgi:WD40 repeat protein
MDTEHRFLIAAGTENYPEYGDEARLQRVPEELRTIVEAFSGLGYKPIPIKAWLNPTDDDLRKGISTWHREKERGPDDIVVLYYTGHGDTTKDKQYYLLTSNSNPENLAGTAVTAGELAGWALEGTSPRRVLVILDTCFAGEGVQEFLERALRRSGPTGRTVVSIASASHRDEAAQGMFATALAREIHEPRWGGESLEYLPLSSLIQGIARRWKQQGQQQRLFSAMFGDELDVFLPNPRYRPELPKGVDLSTRRRLGAMSPEEFRVHWGPRARGVQLDQQAGYYFTGRHGALRRIAAWLRSDVRGAHVLWVTGDPGSGKSAVIGRIVTLSDPGLRDDPMFRDRIRLDRISPETIPAPGSVDLAIHARRKTLSECVQLLSGATGVAAEQPEGVVQALAGRRFCLVVDALDEALESERIWDELLRPLGEISGINVLIGARRSHVVRNREASVLDLDEPEWFDIEDIIYYAEQILLGRDEPDRATPYREQPALAREVAAGIAEKAGRVFLVAQLAARGLAVLPEAIDTTEPTWKGRLPGDFATAFGEYLRRFGADEPRVWELLRPLAYAEGAGFPWEHLWAPAATSMGLAEYSDADVQWVMNRVADYVVEDAEDSRSVYRLYHEKFAEYLRGIDAESKRRDQRQLSKALLDSTPKRTGGGREWGRAHPYVMRHLATHLAAAGSLDTVVKDPAYLAAGDADRLLRVLHTVTSDPAKAAAGVYRLAVHRLREWPLEERLSYLQLIAARLGRTWNHSSFRDQPWHTVWAHGTPTSYHHIIEALSWLTSIAVSEVEGQPVIVSGTMDGWLGVWDLVTGTPRGVPLHGHTSPVTSVAIGALAGRPVIVSGSWDKTVRVWDLATGAPHGAPLKGHTEHVLSVAVGTLAGRPVVVSGSRDRTVRVWDMATGAPHGAPLRGYEWWVDSVAVGILGGQPLIVSSGWADDAVRVWDLATGAPHGAPLLGHTRVVTSVAIGALGDQPVIVSGSSDKTVRVWDLATGAPQGAPLRGHTGDVSSVAVGSRAGRPVIVSGGRDYTVRVWDLTMEALAEGHTGEVSRAAVETVVVATLAGQPVIVSGGADGTVRRWDLATGAPRGVPLEGHTDRVTSVALGALAGRPVIVSGSLDRTVRVWDLATGAPHGRPLRAHTNWFSRVAAWMRDYANRRRQYSVPGDTVTSVAVGILAGQPVIVSGSVDGTVRRWDLATGAPYGAPIKGHTDRVSSVAVGTWAGRPPVIVSGSWDETVRVWDLATGAPHGAPLEGHTSDVGGLAVGVFKGQPLIVSAGGDGVRVWNLATGAPHGAPLQGAKPQVTSVAMGALGGQPVIVSGSLDETVRVWDLAVHQAQVIRWDESPSSLWMADGRIVVAGGLGLALLTIDRRPLE